MNRLSPLTGKNIFRHWAIDLLFLEVVLVSTKLLAIFFPRNPDLIYGFHKMVAQGGYRAAIAADYLNGDHLISHLVSFRFHFAMFDMIFPFLGIPFFWLLGDRAIAFRLLGLFLFMILLAGLYFVFRKYAGRRTALLGGLLFAIGSVGLYSRGLWAVPEFIFAQLFFFPCLALGLRFIEAKDGVNKKSLFGIGALCGLAISMLVTNVLLIMPIVLIAYGRWRKKPGFLHGVGLVSLGFVTGYLPTILVTSAYYLMTSGWSWEPYLKPQMIEEISVVLGQLFKSASIMTSIGENFSNALSFLTDFFHLPSGGISPLRIPIRFIQFFTVILASSFYPIDYLFPEEKMIGYEAWALCGLFFFFFITLVWRNRIAIWSLLRPATRILPESANLLEIWMILTVFIFILLVVLLGADKPYYAHQLHVIIFMIIAGGLIYWLESGSTVKKISAVFLAVAALGAVSLNISRMWQRPSLEQAQAISEYRGSSYYFFGSKVSTAVSDRITFDLMEQAAEAKDDNRACDFLMGQIEGMFCYESDSDFSMMSRFEKWNNPCIWAGYGGLVLPCTGIFYYSMRNTESLWDDLEKGIAEARENYVQHPDEIARWLFFGLGYKLALVATDWQTDPRKLNLLLMLDFKNRQEALQGYEHFLRDNRLVDRYKVFGKWLATHSTTLDQSIN